MSDVLRIVLEDLARALTPAEVRRLTDRAMTRMGEGGSTREWIMAMGTILAEDDNQAGMAALRAGVARAGQAPA
ncbi:MAG TPA: hypothetical protein VKR24_12920 [Candidatus Limnocylindrales bacterium]|nr:hypothetical protein [Candidatus Limnocylindrales bacterium]